MYETVSIFSSLIVAIVTLYLGFSAVRVFIRKEAPFVPTYKDILAYVADEMNLTPSSRVYDLGSGDGRILKYLHSRCPEAVYTGIEYGFIPYILSRVYNRNLFSEKFVIKRKNFFDENLSPATHIVTYLLPNVMDDLLPKLEKELSPGTMLVSIDFAFTHKEAAKTYKPDLHTNRTLGRTVRVYWF